MSRALLRDAIEPLPYPVRDDVLSYATFVEEIAEDRAAQLDISLSPEQRDQVVFLSGVMYVRDMVGGQLALADAATGRGTSYAANLDVRGLRIGSEDLVRGSPYIERLRHVRNQLNRLLTEAGVPSSAHRLSDAIQLVVYAGEH